MTCNMLVWLNPGDHISLTSKGAFLWDDLDQD